MANKRLNFISTILTHRAVFRQKTKLNYSAVPLNHHIVPATTEAFVVR